MQYAKFWVIYFKGKKHSCGIEMNQGIYQYGSPSSMKQHQAVTCIFENSRSGREME
jgi:hypothetical protein